MPQKFAYHLFIFLLLVTSFLASCTAGQPQPTPTLAPPTAAPSPAFDPSSYAFPSSIDPLRSYLFYLHGKIIEDQGLPAVSPEFGEYEFVAMLNRFREAGFVVIAELRPKDTGYDYAQRVKGQIIQLLEAGVLAKNISIVGASKGASLAAAVSNLLENDEVNYVLLGSCYNEMITEWTQNNWRLHGNVLSIYDAVDTMAGSCQELFDMSAGKGICRTDEIVLHVGTGHGILYKPLDEWVLPVIEWAKK